jgi:hypothetical protein
VPCHQGQCDPPSWTPAYIGPGGFSHSADPLSISDSPERLSGVNSHSTTSTEGAMKYLCLIYYEEQKLDALSKRELDALIHT